MDVETLKIFLDPLFNLKTSKGKKEAEARVLSSYPDFKVRNFEIHGDGAKYAVLTRRNGD